MIRRAQNSSTSQPATGTATSAALVGYLVLTGLTGWMLCILQFSNTDLSLPMSLIFLALLCLSVNRWTGALMLILVQLDLLIREPARRGPDGSPASMLFVFLVLALLMFVSRYHVIRQLPGQSLWKAVRGLISAPASGAFEQPSARFWLFSMIRSFFWLPLMVIAAELLLRVVPSAKDATTWVRGSADGGTQLWPGGLLLVVVVGAWVIAGEFAWRQMSAGQARLYTRSVFVRLHYSDLQMIMRRRLKHRSRQLASQRSEPKQDATIQ